MDLQKILSVSGKPGLYKIIGQTKSGVIAEGLLDKKRIPVFATDKMSSLEDIRIFTEDGDVPLKDVFKNIYDKESAGQTTVTGKDSNDALKQYFNEILPDYDKERVYVSDIKKVISWYNLLLENEILNFEEEIEETDENTPEEEISEKLDTPEEKVEEVKPKAKKKTKKE